MTLISTAFAPGQTWDDVVDVAKITAVSPVYDVSDIELRPDGTIVADVAPITPVPEPSTWAMLALGLVMTTTLARRRAAARRR